MTTTMNDYLCTLINEKGVSIYEEIQIEGHFGLRWSDLIDFIVSLPEYHQKIKDTLVKIDFLNGDVFHYLNYLANGMVQSVFHQ